MQRSSLKNNLKPMHNLIFAICFSNMQILYSILSQADFLPASSAQEVSNINSGQIRNFITLISTRFTSVLRTLKHLGFVLSHWTESWVLGRVQHDNVNFPCASFNTNTTQNNYYVVFSLDCTRMQHEFKLICKGWTSLS